jgi:hypothetical protein
VPAALGRRARAHRDFPGLDGVVQSIGARLGVQG